MPSRTASPSSCVDGVREGVVEEDGSSAMVVCPKTHVVHRRLAVAMRRRKKGAEGHRRGTDCSVRSRKEDKESLTCDQLKR
ncbi:hypothetical protein MHYP_G00268270 [Metynnis hypsauchen]